jgi:CRP/FNR family cyclic AMP-dependent transcriptional regulator
VALPSPLVAAAGRRPASPPVSPDRDRLAFLAALARPRTLAAGAVLYYECDPADGLYLVRAGTVALSRGAADGQETILALVGPGGIVGMLELVDDGAREATAMALDPVELLFVPRDTFMVQVATDPERLWSVTRALGAGLRRGHDLVADLVFLDARERLAKRLLELGDSHGRQGADGAIEIGLRLAQRDLAGLVGASRESVNKAIRDLREGGAIAVVGGRVSLLDRAALRRLASPEG